MAGISPKGVLSFTDKSEPTIDGKTLQLKSTDTASGARTYQGDGYEIVCSKDGHIHIVNTDKYGNKAEPFFTLDSAGLANLDAYAKRNNIQVLFTAERGVSFDIPAEQIQPDKLQVTKDFDLKLNKNSSVSFRPSGEGLNISISNADGSSNIGLGNLFTAAYQAAYPDRVPESDKPVRASSYTDLKSAEAIREKLEGDVKVRVAYQKTPETAATLSVPHKVAERTTGIQVG